MAALSGLAWLIAPRALPARGFCVGWCDLPGPRAAQRSAIRAALPELAAAALGQPSGPLTLDDTGATPRLVDAQGAAPLALSLSYAGPRVAFAFATRPVGVDLVAIADLPGWQDVARDFFEPREAARLAALPNPSQAAAFCLAWAELEAHGKALGLGLAEWDTERGARLAEAGVVERRVNDGYALAVALG